MGNAFASSPGVVVAINSSDNLIAVQNKQYKKRVLKGVCDEPTWHRIVRRIEDAVQAAGDRHHARIIQLKCIYITSMVTFIICFLAGFGMLFGGLASGSGALVGVGGFVFAVFAVSLVSFIVSISRIATESKEWLTESVASVSNFSPQLATEFPGLVFAVADVKDTSFCVTLKRGQAPAAPQGHSLVAGSPPAQVPPAGMPQGHPPGGPYAQPQAGYYQQQPPYQQQQPPYQQQQPPYHQQQPPYQQQQQPPYQQQQQQPPYQQQQSSPYEAPNRALPAPPNYSEGV